MRIFRQTDAYSCGPRSLQIAFSHYNVYPAYRELLEVCETDYEGTSPENFPKAVGYYGLCACVHEKDASVDLIVDYTDRDIPVIVMWYAGLSNHVSVAYTTDSKCIYLLDPALHLYTEPVISIRKNMLEKCWKYHDDSKWMMAVIDCDLI